MAGHDDGEELGLPEGKPKKGKKMILILLLVVLLLGGGVAGLYFTGKLDSMLGKKTEKSDKKSEKKDKDSKAKDTKKKGKKDDAKPDEVVYYNLPEFLVNLNTGGNGVSFLKMTVTLELPSKKVLAKLKKKEPRILDLLNTYLRELRATDLGGSAGVYRLREELMLRINKSIHPSKVSDVLFKEIIVQ